MIRVYYAYTDLLPKGKLDDLLTTLSERNQSKWAGYKRLEDKLLLLASSAVLAKVLLENGYPDYKIGDLQYTVEGRPFFPNAPFDFNISHTERCTAVAFSEKGSVGIDIETIKAVDFSDFDLVFTKEVWDKIHASNNENQMFFHFWTLLESAVKADGRGLSKISFKNILLQDNHVILDGNVWFSHHQDFDSSITCCLTSNKQNETVELREIRFA